MATKAEVREKVLRKLRVLAEGESPSAQVQTDTDAAIDEMHAFLAAKNAITWDADEDIPTAAVRPFVSVVASELADEFEVDEMRYNRVRGEASGAIRELIKLATPTYIPQSIVADYY